MSEQSEQGSEQSEENKWSVQASSLEQANEWAVQANGWVSGPILNESIPESFGSQCRASTAVSDKHRAVMAVGVGVPPVAQRLFNTIAKTIDEIKWGGKEAKEICIMSQVRGREARGELFFRPSWGRHLKNLLQIYQIKLPK